MLIRGGTVWDEHGGRSADVRVEGGTVAEVGDLQARPDEDVLDATGLHVLPGMIDAHVHAGDRIGASSWPTAGSRPPAPPCPPASPPWPGSSPRSRVRP